MKILQGDCLQVLKTIPDQSVNCCVTSPPYWGLRDYGTASWEGGDPACDHEGETVFGNNRNFVDREGRGSNKSELSSGDCVKCGAKRIDSQLGLEKTPEEYVANMVGVFRDVKRVLRDDGTLWLNLGSSYAAGGMGGQSEKHEGFGGTKDGYVGAIGQAKTPPPGYKPKDLVPIPWLVALALQADGWYLRSDIIWAKPNPMPESVTDRPTKSHEYIFLLAKSQKYYYDHEAVKEPFADERMGNPKGGGQYSVGSGRNDSGALKTGVWNEDGKATGRNRRSVWLITTSPYKGAHFATFPEKLVEPCILAGTSEKGNCAKCGNPWVRNTEKTMPPLRVVKTAGPVGGHGLLGGHRFDEPIQITTTGWEATCDCGAEVVKPVVLDPFMGSGTTLAVAKRLGRDGLGIELNPEYIKLAEERIAMVGELLPL